MAYQGVFQIGKEQNCLEKAAKCLHGLFDSQNVQRNTKILDQYYGKQNFENEIDERYFINLNGLMHTPIKLISPLNYGSSGKASGPGSNKSGKYNPQHKPTTPGALKRPKQDGDERPFNFPINGNGTEAANNRMGLKQSSPIMNNQIPMQRKLDFT